MNGVNVRRLPTHAWEILVQHATWATVAISYKSLILLVAGAGIEPATYGL